MPTAGTYRTPTGFLVERAWHCERCGVWWFDTLDCPKCGDNGLPEKLDDGDVIVQQPDEH